MPPILPTLSLHRSDTDIGALQVQKPLKDRYRENAASALDEALNAMPAGDTGPSPRHPRPAAVGSGLLRPR